MPLTAAQTSALQSVRDRAEARRPDARATIDRLLKPLSLECATFLPLVTSRARVTLSFHPDRPLADGLTVIDKLLTEGCYRNQFETGISNGARTAQPGGSRDKWEEALFSSAYHQEPTRHDERPKYGGLNLMNHADGACPRFGSCFFELRSFMNDRCTFSWGDSHQQPERVSTIDTFEPMLEALLHAVSTTGRALGSTHADLPSLITALGPSPPHVGRALDDYIEAQVHSDIVLKTDVQLLMIDPAYLGTPTGDGLRLLSQKNGFALQTHPGFVLNADEVPADFRGPRMVPLAARVGEQFARKAGQLDAVAIGEAAQALHFTPDTWADWASPDETLQQLKQLWHVLVQYGRPRVPRSP